QKGRVDISPSPSMPQNGSENAGAESAKESAALDEGRYVAVGVALQQFEETLECCPSERPLPRSAVVRPGIKVKHREDFRDMTNPMAKPHDPCTEAVGEPSQLLSPAARLDQRVPSIKRVLSREGEPPLASQPHHRLG